MSDKEVAILKAGAESAKRSAGDASIALATHDLLAYAADRLEKHPGATGGMTQYSIALARHYIRKDLDLIRRAMRSAAGKPSYETLKAQAKEAMTLLAPDAPETTPEATDALLGR